LLQVRKFCEDGTEKDLVSLRRAEGGERDGLERREIDETGAVSKLAATPVFRGIRQQLPFPLEFFPAKEPKTR
jgi:hypothetical protein